MPAEVHPLLHYDDISDSASQAGSPTVVKAALGIPQGLGSDDEDERTASGPGGERRSVGGIRQKGASFGLQQSSGKVEWDASMPDG